MGVIKWILTLWRTPSDFAADAWGYLFNQLGHALVIGGIGAWLCGPDLIWLWILAYALIVEGVQLVVFDAIPSDGVDDTAHMATGAVALANGWWPVLVCQALFIAAGAARRIEAARIEAVPPSSAIPSSSTSHSPTEEHS